MEKKSTLPEAVAAMQQLHLSGNVIPPMWYRTMAYRNKRGTYPHLLAINILADICYWYRPKEVRDEKTGKILGYEKKFKADRLQRSYSQICEMFGCSEVQARDAIEFLEARKLILKEYRHSKCGRKNWQMYLEPNVAQVKAHTYPDGDNASLFDFITKGKKGYAREGLNQDCEFATSQKKQGCELATSGQDGELTTSEIVSSPSSIYTETTNTETTNSIPLSGNRGEGLSGPPPLLVEEGDEVNEAGPNGVITPKIKNGKAGKGKKGRPEIHLAIDAFLEVREGWLRMKSGGMEVSPDQLSIEWTGKEVGQLNRLATYLKAKARKAGFDYEGPEGYAEEVLKPFLRRYAQLNEWYSTDFLPSHIVSHFNRIYDDIKAGKATNRATSASSASNYRAALEAALAGM